MEKRKSSVTRRVVGLLRSARGHTARQFRAVRGTRDDVEQAFQMDANTANDVPVCKIEDSPFRMIQVAAKGNLEEFQRLYDADPSRLNLKDSKGFTPAHKAAEFGRLNILKFIHEHGGDLNVQDKQGNTPLHAAVKNEQVSCITFLLEQGVNSAILNEDELGPIHLAVEVNATKSLKALLCHGSVDPNLRGEKGLLPLHYCAYKDRDECAKILLEYGARPCIKCDNGFFPINIAGKCAAAKTLEILIRHVEALGYKREDVLTFSDKENNMPLHCAVNSGDILAVQVCLNAGAPVDAKQEDSSTPLHFACAQGSLDMVQMMAEMQPERFQNALVTQDILKMTPLHRAALFDHVNVVHFLIEKMTLFGQGADINAQDTHDRTPLLLASSKGGFRTVQYLLQQGAEIGIKDKDNRNFLHLAIKGGVSIENFGCNIIKDLKNLLNDRDAAGCTPLHYASKEGHLVAIDDLLKFGATINPKDNDKKSPLHFAANYGRYNTVKRLLESHMGPNIINETDGDGLSALHMAALNGHTKIITALMQKGAYVTRDNNNNTPLHLAAKSGYTRSIKLLLQVYPNLLNCANKDGDTALHLAAKEGHVTAVELLMDLDSQFTLNRDDQTFMDITLRERHSDVAFAIIRHDRWEEVLKLNSKEFDTPMNGLVQHLPDACMAALDRCQTTSNHDRRSSEYAIHYNFKYLQCPLRFMKGKDRENRNNTPMLALNTMVRHGRVQCLSHPLAEAFLNMKWRAYGAWFHVSNFVTYVIYMSLLTVLVSTTSYSLDVTTTSFFNTTTNETEIRQTSVELKHIFEYSTFHVLSVYIVLIFCCLSLVKEIVQIFQQRAKYFMDMTNALEWVLFVSTLLYIIPFMSQSHQPWQWETGAITIFLAWFNCLLFLQRFDFFGIYVVMFLEILRTLIQVLCVFSILLVAFGLAFYTLMQNEENHGFMNPGISLLRTVMMMFELDFMASFNGPYTDDDERTLYFGSTTIVLLLAFVLLMPILLMNLLIGLAVGDIESVKKNATLKRLAMQVELHTDLERKLPARILEWVDKSELTVYPNKCKASVYMVRSPQVWSKISFLGDYTDGGDVDNGLIHQTQLYDELYKQKIRIREISSNVNKQYELIRLIVQKMEIHTEEENKDEGCTGDQMFQKSSKWRPASNSLVRQSAIVAHWKNSMSLGE